MATMTKHVGKLKSTGKRVAVIFREIYDDTGNVTDHTHALVVDTDALPNMWADSFMDAVLSSEGQDTINFFEVANRKVLPDGRVILRALVDEGRMVKVRTNEVVMEPDNSIKIPLNELNENLTLIESGVTTEPRGTMSPESAVEIINAREAGAAGATTSEDFAGDNAKQREWQLRTQSQKLREDAKKLDVEADNIDPQPKRGRGRPKKADADASS